MTGNRRKLLLLLGVLFAAVLVVRILPFAYSYYRAGREDIAALEERIERFETLIQDQEQWEERETLKQAEITDLESWIFPGSNPNLVSTNLQRLLRQAADQAGIAVREMRVSENSYVGEWLMVSQEISFTLEESQILPFLSALQQLRPRLHVAAFNVSSSNRRGFTGNITVVGFSRGMTAE